MENVCLVTMWEVWILETNNGLMYKPCTPAIFGPKLKLKGVACTQVFMVVCY